MAERIATIQERTRDRLLHLFLTKPFGVLGWGKGDKINYRVENGEIILSKQ